MRLSCNAWLAVIALLIWWPAAFGWGNEGHRITGYVANSLLTEHARTQLVALVGTDDLSQLAPLLDLERDELEQRFPGSNRWHYENRQVCHLANSKPQCPKGQCITQQIERFEHTLQTTQSSQEQRADAIRGLAHLIGDLHQPLHLTDNNDRGGNDVTVLLPGEKKPRNLHDVWDSRFLRMNVHRRDEQRYAQSLLKQFASRQTEWPQGDSQHWAQESFLIGQQFVYQALPNFACGVHDNIAITLPDTYIESARHITAEQITKSGMRLAFVINNLLK